MSYYCTHSHRRGLPVVPSSENAFISYFSGGEEPTNGMFLRAEPLRILFVALQEPTVSRMYDV